MTTLDNQDVAEQAALFACNIDGREIGELVRDALGGQAGIYGLIASESMRFLTHHIEASKAEPYNGDMGLYWDSEDWYKLSDKWFEEQIEPVLWPEG